MKILHNPRCSKSRMTLQLLQENGHQPEVQLYLEDPPSVSELEGILAMLGLRPQELMRKGEAEYRELGLAVADLDDRKLVEIMVANPRLIERPIVISDGRAAIGRPPESVLEIL
jgi:arsenate reductase